MKDATLTAPLDMLACPRCRADLEYQDSHIVCKGCAQCFTMTSNIPQFYWGNDDWGNEKGDVTETIKAFYEQTPFPNYDNFDDTASLIDKAKEGVFARLLDEQIPAHAKILEVGCGTGQLSAFLSVANRTVYGADMCMNSLQLAENFRNKNQLKNLHLLQMNLFRPAFKDGGFDLVISNGVLHHTSDPRLAFNTIARLVKPGGYILIGLYHKYGRLITDTRRLIFSVAGDSLDFLDPHLRKVRASGGKWKAWFMDQYHNPHESKHTISETMPWFDEEGFDVLKTIPKTKLFSQFTDREKLFQKDEFGSSFERTLVELGMITKGSAEGGFFIV